LKVLKGYGAPKNDHTTFYCCVIRSNLGYGAQVWNGNLTQAQRNDIERVQKRALRIIVPEYEYNRALQQCELKTFWNVEMIYVFVSSSRYQTNHHINYIHSFLGNVLRFNEEKLEQIRTNFITSSAELKDLNAVR
jgi:hypothetical protein